MTGVGWRNGPGSEPARNREVPWMLKLPRMVTVEAKEKTVNKEPHGHKGRCLSENVNNPTPPP